MNLGGLPVVLGIVVWAFVAAYTARALMGGRPRRNRLRRRIWPRRERWNGRLT